MGMASPSISHGSPSTGTEVIMMGFERRITVHVREGETIVLVLQILTLAIIIIWCITSQPLFL